MPATDVAQQASSAGAAIRLFSLRASLSSQRR